MSLRSSTLSPRYAGKRSSPRGGGRLGNSSTYPSTETGQLQSKPDARARGQAASLYYLAPDGCFTLRAHSGAYKIALTSDGDAIWEQRSPCKQIRRHVIDCVHVCERVHHLYAETRCPRSLGRKTEDSIGAPRHIVEEFRPRL
jgi:hypothetical protein